MADSNTGPLVISGLALTVSVATAVSTFIFNKQKAARELWQKQLELYIANPSHLLGRPANATEESEQAYRAHVGYIFLSLEELLRAYPRDSAWHNLIRRHITRHAAYVSEVLADPDRHATYSLGLRKKMDEVLNAHL